MKIIILTFFVINSLSLIAYGSDGEIPLEKCNEIDDVEFYCGPDDFEDMVRVPETEYLIAPYHEVGKALFAIIDTRNLQYSEVKIQSDQEHYTAYSDCRSTFDADSYKPFGISIMRQSEGSYRIYAVNNSERSFVEVFELVMGAQRAPHISWRGCVSLPEGFIANSVTPTINGGFFVTQFYDRSKGNSYFEQFQKGMKSGAIYQWKPESGLSKISGSEGVGNNGIYVNSNKQYAIASLWAENALLKVDLMNSVPPQRIRLPFMPDNIKVDGSAVIVTGHGQNIPFLAECRVDPLCFQDSMIIRVDPESLSYTPLLNIKGSAEFDAATTGIVVGGYLWVAGYRTSQLARYKLENDS